MSTSRWYKSNFLLAGNLEGRIEVAAVVREDEEVPVSGDSLQEAVLVGMQDEVVVEGEGNGVEATRKGIRSSKLLMCELSAVTHSLSSDFD